VDKREASRLSKASSAALLDGWHAASPNWRAMTLLTPADFAERAGCTEAQLSALRELGILGGDGSGHDAAEVNRVRLALSLEAAGIALPDLAAAIRAGLLSLDFTGQLMFEPVALTGIATEDGIAGLGLPTDVVRRLRSAMGLSELEAGAPLREDDRELLQLIAAARGAGLSDDSLARVLRVFGQATRRTVEAMRDLFRSQVEEPMLASGASSGAMLATTAALRLQLQRLGFRALHLLQRRMLEDAVFDNVATRIQEALPARAAGAAETAPGFTVVFADLSGYTMLTHRVGDAEAAEQAAAFEAIGYETAVIAGGRFIKSMGDGILLQFGDSATALDTSFRLRDYAKMLALPPLRIGLATGSVVPRDGDIFGSTVNLAARAAAEAVAEEVLACDATVGQIPAVRLASYRFTARQPAALKGFPAPTTLYAVSRAV